MKNWEKAQERVAKLFNGKVVPYSGQGKLKGDVTTKNCLIEVKETTNLWFTVTAEMLDKISEEAWVAKKVPVLVIELGNGSLLVVVNILPCFMQNDKKSIKLTEKDIGRVIGLGKHSWRILSEDHYSEI